MVGNCRPGLQWIGMKCLLGLAAALLIVAGPASASAQTTTQAQQLMKARQAYNQGRFDDALAAGIEARRAPATAAAATVVVGRAYLEKFRVTGDATSLQMAHQLFSEVDPGALAPREQHDLRVGLGMTVFYEGRPGAAAELLEVVLVGASHADELGARDKIFDWWATALDRAAQLVPEHARVEYYTRIVTRSEAELVRDPSSVAASYWLAAGARGAGQLDRAWHAAIAAWIRAKSARADIAQLVEIAIIPERARALDTRDTPALISAMRAEWEQIKGSW